MEVNAHIKDTDPLKLILLTLQFSPFKNQL